MMRENNHARRAIRWLGLVLVATTLVVVAAAPGRTRNGSESRLRAVPERFEKAIFRSLRLRDREPRNPFSRPGSPAASTGFQTQDVTVQGLNLNDLSSDEIRVDAPLPTVGGYDFDVVALGRPGGALCVLAIEDFLLRTLRSTDGGQTFAAEVDVTGGPGPGAVIEFAAVLADDDTIYAAMIVADAAGDRGLRFARSTDSCQTWSAATDLVSGGGTGHGVTDLALAAGSSGFVAVVFVGQDGLAPYALTSTNSGSTWTSPVRLDPGSGSSFFAVGAIDVAVDPASTPNDNIYVAYGQDRGSGSSVWYTRSTDEGVTFAAEQNLDAITPNRAGSDSPAIRVVESGNVLIAYWDEFSLNKISVARSTDEGQTFSSAHEEVIGGGAPTIPPVIGHTAGSSVIQLVYGYNGALWHIRSTDNGASFKDAFNDPVSTILNTTTDADPNGVRDIAPVRLIRTENGDLVVAWSDTRGDTYARSRTDIYTSRSTDGGQTWGLAERADSDAPGAAESTIGGLVPIGGDDFFVVWVDRRNGSGGARDIYANRHTAGTMGFGTDFRIDADARPASAANLREPVVATDGGSGVYVAFTARSAGHEMDIYVARSTDGGYSFGTPVRVGSTPAGARVELGSYLAATPDGNVYLAFLSDNPVSGLRELRFNHSADFGATWQASDTVLDDWAHPVGYFINSFDFPNVQLRAVNGGIVYVAWSDNSDVWLARSFNAGATFLTDDVDQDSRGFNRYPALCAQGGQVVLALMAPDLAFNFLSVWGTVSTDSGASWTSLQQLRSESTPERAIFPVVACDGAGGAVAAWADLRSGTTWELFANRWSGAAWTGDVQISSPSGEHAFWPSPSFAGAGTAVVGFENLAGRVYAARSTDGGLTFPSHQRLDDVVPDPDVLSETPRTVSDGDDVWVFWKEMSAGETAIAARASTDAGLSYGPVYRLNRELPQGAFPNTYFIINAAAAALPDVGFMAWGARRDDMRPDVLINAFDLDDGDRDTFGAASDCDNADPSVWAAPIDISGLLVEILTGGSGDTRVSWDSQDGSAGSATSYDIVRGRLSDLNSSRNFAAASCLSGGFDDTPFDDGSSPPLPGDGFYYLLRARNSCGTGSYGDSSLTPDPRDGLDLTGPCP